MADLSTSIRVLSGKLRSVVESEFASRHKKSVSYLQIACSKLASISAAGEMPADEGGMNMWDQLLQLIYDADDLADEILYEETRRELEADESNVAYLARSLIPSFGGGYSKAIKSRIKQIGEAIDLISDGCLKLSVSSTQNRRFDELFQSSHRLPTTSMLSVTEIVGREEERSDIVRLLQSDTDLEVMSITGVGGCGKTTLAKLVYNDDIVHERFQLKAWISVSFDFSVEKLTWQIVQAIASDFPGNYNLELLQITLRERLAGRRFLLVLDDVWNENVTKWDLLRTPLKSGARGSKILITTRSENVASVMGCSTSYKLNLLSEEECWSLFKISVSTGMEESVAEDLEDIGRGIVKKCHGIPLAAKAIGELLRSKRIREEWRQVLDSISFLSKDGPLLPSLKLSYDHLPAHLKPCFAYCSLFPSGYEFEKEKLVLLWMAEGFLLPSDGQSMEQVAADCFDGLLKRSLLVPVGGSYFRMHDLMHDLASNISRELSVRLESYHSISKRTRHLSLTANTLEKFLATHEATRLRTFLLFNSPSYHESTLLSPHALEDFWRKQQRLRVLSLPQFQNAQLPNSIGKLKHLRHLDVSESALQSLPESLFTLYHLQTLILTNCKMLIMLPKSIVKLFNLRHLYIQGTGLQQMPGEMSRLECLQTLTNFIVGEGLNIKELGALRDLRGTLLVSNLQNIFSLSNVSGAKLKDKRYLNELRMEWNSNEGDPVKDMTVLQKLEPSKELRKLTIQSYGGIEFPSWLGDSSFSNMVFLCLRECYNCSFLPPLGQLPSLQDLIIERIVGVRSIGHEFYEVDESISKPFPSLKTLTFEGMTQWEQWISLQDEEFPCLQKLYLVDCPKLNGSLPKSLPSLLELRISDCQQLAALLPRTPYTCKEELSNCDKVHYRSEDDNLSGTDDEEVSHFPSSTSEISSSQHEGFSEFSIPSKKDEPKAEMVKKDEWKAKIVKPKAEMVKKNERTEKMVKPKAEMVKKDERKAKMVKPEAEMVKKDEPRADILKIKAEMVEKDELKAVMVKKDEPRADMVKLKAVMVEKDEPKAEMVKKDEARADMVKLKAGMMKKDELKAEMVKIKNDEPKAEMVKKDEFFDSFSSSSSVTFKVSIITKLMELPATLRSLRIERINAVEFLPTGILDRPLLQRLYIVDCDLLKTFPQLDGPSSLRRLYIHNCRNLQFPRHNEMANKCNLLEHLYLGSSCDSLESFPLNSFQNLKTLSLWDCRNLGTLSMEKGLPHELKSLEVLEIRDCPNLATFPKEGLQASNLTSLVLSYCNNLRSMPRWMQNLTSLQSLHINKCRELQPLSPWPLPSSLNILCISFCDKIIPQLAWELNKLQSLSHFEIEGGCQNLLSFPEEGVLPPNLKSLRITRLPNLKSLDGKGLQQLTSLQSLDINGCNELSSFPEDGLPSSLCLLNITECSLLNQKLKKRKGKEWSEIAHILSIHLGEVSGR